MIYPVQPFFLVNTTKYYKKIVPETPYVHFYSFTADAEGAELSAAVPNACVDLLFTFTGERVEGRVCGFVTKRRGLALPRGARCFGVRFRPGWLPEALGLSLPELVDRRLDLADYPQGMALMENIAQGDGFLTRIEGLRTFVRDRWQGHALLTQFIAEVAASGGAISVAELEARTLYSARYINRVFHDNLGMSPKTFAKCVRFQRLIGLMNGWPRPGFAGIAAEAGYCDQPHFNREFKELSALTPREYIAAVDPEHYQDKLVYV
ncbi:MAG: helix-turn-helix domain-containing protein [Gracilibacteraceae bacterium]|jgi:AraC-like DNA-binding protein|nr:helix-turn-helix domain-containing protein [Gracilibacteraceae bacterium]